MPQLQCRGTCAKTGFRVSAEWLSQRISGEVTEGVVAGEAVFRILWTLLSLSVVFPSVSLRHVSTRHHIVMFVCLDKATTDSFQILPSS